MNFGRGREREREREREKARECSSCMERSNESGAI
jgi:hypothetical protein